MNGVSIEPLQRAGGSLALVCMPLAMVSCTVKVGWSARYDDALGGRTPASFAAACASIDGALVAVENDRGGARSSCTVQNGDAITCD